MKNRPRFPLPSPVRAKHRPPPPMRYYISAIPLGMSLETVASYINAANSYGVMTMDDNMEWVSTVDTRIAAAQLASDEQPE